MKPTNNRFDRTSLAVIERIKGRLQRHGDEFRGGRYPPGMRIITAAEQADLIARMDQDPNAAELVNLAIGTTRQWRAGEQGERDAGT